MDYDSDEDFDFSDEEQFEGENESENVDGSHEISPAKRVTGVKHLLQLKETLQLDSFSAKKKSKQEKKRRQKERKRLKKQQQTGSSGSAIQTLATKLSGKVYSAPEVVVFEDPRKKQKTDNASGHQSKPALNQSQPVDRKKAQEEAELAMKQAKFEVFKFSLSGMDKADQIEARVAQAIKLGAKPAKKACLPYNELKAKIRTEKEESKRQKEMLRVTGMVTSSRSVQRSTGGAKSKSDKSQKTDKKASKKFDDIGIKVGKFDGGMLKLTAKDLAKIKSKK